ncbi:Uncharacterised protein [Serratia quinivorans]|nr:Uncharacterised protein [Serratia quinivorans]CAI2159944.1 Uncharacterised protein [Serratia quinivorans]
MEIFMIFALFIIIFFCFYKHIKVMRGKKIQKIR